MSAGFDFSMHASLDQMAGHGRAGGRRYADALPGEHGESGGSWQQASPAWAAELWPIEIPAVQFLGSGAPFFKALWGPNTGYAWAITRLTVAGLTGTDAMLVYRGYSGAADVQPQNIVAPPITPAAPTIYPGNTGLVLMPDQALVFAGTLTGASIYTVSGNATQVTVDRLPRYLE
jgi:hypothetical protein